MPIYRYKAANQKGEIISGTYSAVDADEVVVMVRSNSFFPIEVAEVVDSEKSRNLTFNTKVSLKDLSVLCNQFNTLLKSGVTVIQCIETFRAQSENKMMKDAFAQVYRDVQTGVILSEALRIHKRVFPEFLVNMIQSGEMSGNLDSVTERLSVHYSKENAIRNKVSGAMIYPMILSVLATLVVAGLMAFVMPMFVQLFEDSGAELPWLTLALVAASDFMVERWYVVLMVVAALAIVLPPLIASPAGKMFFDRLALRITVVRNLTLKVSASRFSRTMSTLLYSGIPLIQSLEITAKIVGNKVYEKVIMEACNDVKKGSDLSAPLELSGLFPVILCNMIRIGEASGRLDESLERAADLYDSEVDDAVAKLSAFLEPTMIVVMAFVIGIVVLAIAMPMFGMYENLTL